MTSLNAAVAREHRFDLMREAARYRVPEPDETPADREHVILRLAEAADGPSVHRLETLDEQTALAGRILLAVRGSEAVAALSLTDGRVAANPFEPTADAVALLRLRAEHLGQPAHHARRWRRRSIRRLRWA